MTHPDTARLQQAVWRLVDLLKDDYPQAWKEARKFLERLKKEQWQEAQQQADALDAKPAAPVVWPEPFAIYDGERWYADEVAAICFGVSIHVLEEVYTRAQVEAMLEAQGVKP